MSIHLQPLYQAKLKSKSRSVPQYDPILIEKKSSIEINMDVIEKENAEKQAQIKQTQQILSAFIPLSTPAPYEISATEFKELERDPIDQPVLRDDEIKMISRELTVNRPKLALGLFLSLVLIFALFVINRSNLSLFIDDPFTAIEKAFNPEIKQEEAMDGEVQQEAKIRKTTQYGTLEVLPQSIKMESLRIDGKNYLIANLSIQNNSNRVCSNIQVEGYFGGQKTKGISVHLIKDEPIKIEQLEMPSKDVLQPGEKALFRALVDGKYRGQKVGGFKILFFESR